MESCSPHFSPSPQAESLHSVQHRLHTVSQISSMCHHRSHHTRLATSSAPAPLHTTGMSICCCPRHWSPSTLGTRSQMPRTSHQHSHRTHFDLCLAAAQGRIAYSLCDPSPRSYPPRTPRTQCQTAMRPPQYRHHSSSALHSAPCLEHTLYMPFVLHSQPRRPE